MKVVRSRDGHSSPEPLPERFPHLAAFLAGYLHQDFVLDHKTPDGALEAFLADAGPDDRAALKQEWVAFRQAVEGMSLRELRQALSALGGAWRPASRAALLGLFDRGL